MLGVRAQAAAVRGPEPEVLLSVPRHRLASVRAALLSHGGALLVLSDEPTPPWARGFSRPAFVAATFGALGALGGGWFGRGESALPVVGRLPTSVVAAAAFGGALAAFAFALAFVLDQLVSSGPEGPRVLCWVRGPLTEPDAVVLGVRIVARLPDRTQ